MPDRVAIVTDGLRGLGRAMTPALAAYAITVPPVGHFP